MKKRTLPFTNVKRTKLGKGLHVFSWAMLLIWIFIGSSLLAGEFSLKSVVMWLLCGTAGGMQWIGLQVLIARYEEKQKRTQELQPEQPPAQQAVQPVTPAHVPQPDARDCFEAAGKQYTSFDDLCKVKIPWEENKWTRLFYDIHGRLVLYTTERYPCFDWADAISETRRYHLFYILTNSSETMCTRWTCVRFPDEKTGAEVLFEDQTHEEMMRWVPSIMEPLILTVEKIQLELEAMTYKQFHAEL